MRSTSRLVVALSIALTVVAACSSPAPSVPPTIPPQATPTASAIAIASPTPAAPSASPARPSPFPGAPSIGAPYWLLHEGHDNSVWKEKSGSVIRTDAGETYQVIDGGGLVGTILFDGTPVGFLAVTTTTGDSGVGLTPIEEQYGALITSPRPKDWHAPTEGWTRRTGTWGTTQVWIREPKASAGRSGITAQALWWVEDGSTWADLQINEDGDVGLVLEALLGAQGQ